MSALALISSFFSSITNPYQKSDQKCNSVADLYTIAKSFWHKGLFLESFRLFYDLEQNRQYKPSDCAWYQIHCLVQLGHWKIAIQKCHAWIHKEPGVAKWYLIASDIHFDRAHFTLAWEELNRASLAVSEMDNAFTEICFKKRVALEGARQLPTEIQNDILYTLPFDLLYEIFLLLDLSSLVRCTRVSRKWRQFLISSSHLWNKLEFPKHADYLEINTVETYLGRPKRTRLTKISIHNQQVDGDSMLLSLALYECHRLKSLMIDDVICSHGLFFAALEYIGPHLLTLYWGGVSIRFNDLVYNLPTICKKIQHLTIRDCFASPTDIQLDENALHNLEYFGELFPSSFLKSIQALPKFSHVESLEISGIHGFTANHLVNILARCPNLKKLVMKRCLINVIPVLNVILYFCPELQFLEYERNRYCQQFDLLQHEHLQRLMNSHQRQVLQQKRRKKQLTLKQLPWIQLKMKSTNMLTDLTIQTLLRNGKSTLKTLDLQGNTLITDQGFDLDDQPMNSLQRLCLKDCHGLSANGISKLIRSSPLLQEIDLSGISVINDGLLYAISNCQNLLLLNLSYCRLQHATEEAFKKMIDKHSQTLQRLILDHTTYITMELYLYTIIKIKSVI